MRKHFPHPQCLSAFVLTLGMFVAGTAPAVTPTDELLPITTKGYLSVPDIQALKDSFSTIGLGKIIEDESFKPFIEDLRRQINDRLATTSGRLGISVDALSEICAGEVCIAFVQPDDKTQKHAVVAITDVTGKQAEVEKLQAEINTGMTKRGAQRSEQKIAGIDVIKYEVPIKKGSKKTFSAFIFTHEDQLFAADHPGVVQQLIKRLLNKDQPSLAAVKSYRETIDRCTAEAAGVVPHVRWYVDPIGYAEVVRDAAAATRKRKRTDMTAAMKAQGFDAIRGAGGLVTFGTEDYEIRQNAYVYAPALPRAEGEEKYKLAARMLAQSLADPLVVPGFVPEDISSFAAAAWDIQASYEYVNTLIDEVAGEEGFFDDLIDSLKNDPNGPQVDIKRDLVANLGTHVLAYTDAQLPVSPTSERMLLAVELTNPEAMAASLEKMLKTDPDAQPREHAGHTIWEIINEDGEAPELEIEGAGDFGDIPAYDDDFDDEAGALAALWSNAAISVVKGYVVISSHTEMVIEMIGRANGAPSLADQEDFKAILKALATVKDDNKNCLRLFSRSDRELRTSYELIRQGRMPESDGLIGRLLNTALAPKEKNAVREQAIDGSMLPEFDKIQKYLGPLGIYCRPEQDGWYWSGVAIKRAPEQILNGQREAISTAAAETEETDK